MISEAEFYLQELEKAFVQNPNHDNSVGIPYASNFGSGFMKGDMWPGVDINAAISSSAWYLFGKTGFDPFAIEYDKNIPESEKFWLSN